MICRGCPAKKMAPSGVHPQQQRRWPGRQSRPAPLPNAGNDNSKGAAYNERADRRSPEDIKCLEQFEPEIRKLAADKGVAGDLCWEAWVSKGETRDFRFFNLYSVAQPSLYLVTGYEEGFLRRVSRDEFREWLAGTHGSTD
jgi:hypothetical protein